MLSTRSFARLPLPSSSIRSATITRSLTTLQRHTLTRQLTPFTQSTAHFSTTPSSSHSNITSEFTPTLSRSIFDSIRTWLTNIPRGFKNFYPEGSNEPSKEQKTNNDQQEPSNNDNNDNKSEFNNNRKPNKKPDDNNSPPWAQIIAFGGIGIILYFLSSLSEALNEKELTYQDFKTRFLDTGRVERLVVDTPSKKVKVYLRNADGTESHSNEPAYYFYIGSVDSFDRQLEDAQRDLDVDPRDYVPVKYISDGMGATQFIAIAGQLAFMGFLIYLVRSGMGGGLGGKAGGGRNIFSIGKSPATMVKPGEMTKVTFKDVAGLDDAKVEVMEFVKFLKDPAKFTRLGAKIPKGALLVGPPGTGKTLLAKAMAGEASVPFFSISGSDFIEMFVGVGPSRVRDLFAQARQHAPCIIFIDEIDAVGRSRSKGNFSGGHDERENTLNQLLVEMDGFATTEGVVVLAGTNRKDILDKALLRPGRFDRQITIDKPDIRGRAQIFRVHLKKLKLSHPIDDLSQRLAALTPGFAGADIANLCNEAALIAARADKNTVDLVDFEKATDRIIGGLEKSHNIMSALEKKLVAYHEAGHAVIGWFLEHADPLLKVTIVPRGSGALGFAQYLPKEVSLYHQQHLLDMMCMALGGRAAEQVFFGRVSTGAADDLKKVTKIAQAQVVAYGMSDRLGNVAYEADADNPYVKPFSESTGQQIDEEIRTLVKTAYDRSLLMIQTHKAQVEALAEKLIAVETINHDVLVDVLGPRPFVTDTYKAWIQQNNEELQRQAQKESDEQAAKDKAATQKKTDVDSNSGDTIPMPA